MDNALPLQRKGAAIVEGDSAPNITDRPREKARLTCHTADAAPFTVTGKTARVLRLLETRAGGITPLDCIPWTVRLGSIIFQLRHRYGLDIETTMEAHEGGLHARYVLRTSIKLVAE